MRSRTKTAGFTLIEVMIAMVIITIVAIGFLYVLMSARNANTVLTASMTANSVLRAHAERALAVAAANADLFEGSRARAFVAAYGSLPPLGPPKPDIEEQLPIDANGGNMELVELQNGGKELVYRFAVPEPGDFYRKDAATDEPIYYDRGFGEMRIYLDESRIPDLKVTEGSFAPPVAAGAAGADTAWAQLGGNPGDAASDGKLENLFPGTINAAAVRNPPASLTRVFADLTVTYFSDPGHTRRLTVNERRILVTGTANKDGRIFY